MDGCSLQEPWTIEWQILETLDFKISFNSSIEIKVLPLFVISKSFKCHMWTNHGSWTMNNSQIVANQFDWPIKYIFLRLVKPTPFDAHS
jgi:hypothetical protein